MPSGEVTPIQMSSCVTPGISVWESFFVLCWYFVVGGVYFYSWGKHLEMKQFLLKPPVLLNFNPSQEIPMEEAAKTFFRTGTDRTKISASTLAFKLALCLTGIAKAALAREQTLYQ